MQQSFFDCSLSKGHPIETLDQVRAHYKKQGIAIRVLFRGPRSGALRAYCLKKNARTFAVYPR